MLSFINILRNLHSYVYHALTDLGTKLNKKSNILSKKLQLKIVELETHFCIICKLYFLCKAWPSAAQTEENVTARLQSKDFKITVQFSHSFLLKVCFHEYH